MRIHHIGIACEDIDAAVNAYAKLFPVKHRSGKVFDAAQNATVEMVVTDTGLNVEFIEGPKVSGVVQRGITYYHLCYEVTDLGMGIRELTEGGALLVSAPQPAVLFDERRVAFLFTPSGMVELLEE